MLRIGVLGAGHLGKIHMNCILGLPEIYQFVGFYDPSPEMAAIASEKFGVRAYESLDDLIDDVDVVDIVTPTLSHFECASKALKKSKHVFIEKPITNTLDEAKILMNLGHEANVKIQVGHVERFNPAFVNARPYIQQPRFIETHRLAEFNPRGTDVSVVLDLMIHDIDIILSVIDSNVKRVMASGVSVVSETPDIANARIEFDNGSVANLTASRISLKNMRKSRFFQKDAYVSVDFLEKKTEVVRMRQVIGELDPFALNIDLGEGKGHKEILFDRPDIQPTNAIQEELRALALSINNDSTPIVTVDDGYKALDVAYQILDKLKLSSQLNDDLLV